MHLDEKKKKGQNEHIKCDIFVCAFSHKYPIDCSLQQKTVSGKTC